MVKDKAGRQLPSEARAPAPAAWASLTPQREPSPGEGAAPQQGASNGAAEVIGSGLG